MKQLSAAEKLETIDQISPWILQNKSQLYHYNNTNQNNEQEVKENQEVQLQGNITKSKFKSLSITKLNNLNMLRPRAQEFQTIPRVYRIFQSKIKQTNHKSQNLYRRTSECYFKDIRSPPVNYQEFKINENKQCLPIQLKSNGKMMNPQRFYSRKEQPKYKQDLNQILRKTLKTPAMCNRIKTIVKQNTSPNIMIQRKYSLPMRFVSNQYGYNYYEKSNSELRKTQISFRPNFYAIQPKPLLKQNKKFVIRVEKKHILDKFLEKYHD